MGFLRKIIKEGRRGFDHATGKDKIKKQYRHGLAQSYVLENEMKAKLYLQLCTEQNKVREYRNQIQMLTQEETERFLREKEALPKLLAEKEIAFREGCQQIEHSMQAIRLALYACMTGDIAVVESLLKKTVHAKQVRDIFFKLFPLHIAAEYNHPKIIALLGSYGVNFTRFNQEENQAIDLALIQGNKEAIEALMLLEQKTQELWLILKQNTFLAFLRTAEKAAVLMQCNKELIERITILKQKNLQKGLKTLEDAADFMQGNKEVIKGLMLWEHSSRASCLAREQRYLQKVLKALQEGPDLNALNEGGMNILSFALENEHKLEIIACLIQHYADFNPNGSLEENKALIEEITEPKIRSLLVDSFLNNQGLLSLQQDTGLLNEGPHWIDAHGWSLPPYHDTVRSVMAEINGHKQLFVLGRAGLTGIHLHSYDFINNVWITHPIGPHWVDHYGYSEHQYMSTIRLTVAQVNKQDHLFLLIRNSAGIDLWRYNPLQRLWEQESLGIRWSNQVLGLAPHYYGTIGLATIRLNMREQLFIWMRCGHGMDLWCFDPQSRAWLQQTASPQWADHHGYLAQEYYSSIRAVVAPVEDTFGIHPELFMLARNCNGIDLWSYNPLNSKWKQHAFCNLRALDQNAHPEIPYSDLKVEHTHTAEANLLHLFVRQGATLQVLNYNIGHNTWKKVKEPASEAGAAWSDIFYANSLQLKSISAYNGSAHVLFLGHSAAGIMMRLYNPNKQSWLTVACPAPLPTVFRNLDMHVAIINNQHRVLCLSRTPNGIQSWTYVLNLGILETYHDLQKMPAPFLSLSAEEYQQTIQSLEAIHQTSSDLLAAAKQGDCLAVQASLRKGADINALNPEGYNTLQVAIKSKKLTVPLLNILIKAGIEIEPQRTLALSQQYMPEISLVLSVEPVIGVYKSLNPAMDNAALKTSFQEHCERAQRFLDKYPEDRLKLEAMMAYYLWLSKAEPYALYVMPTLVLLSQLSVVMKKAESSLTDDLAKEFPKKQILEAAQLFFKRTRAMHCILNELGTRAYDLNTEAEFMNFEWSYVQESIQLKREAQKLAKGKSIHNHSVIEAVSNS